MSESISTSIAKAFERTFSTIQIANGYLTNSGLHVYRGFYAHALQAKNVQFPLVAIQPDTEGVDSVSGTGREFKITETVRIVVVTDDVVIPADILRDCLHDIRRALALNWDAEKGQLPGVRAPQCGLAEFAIAADSPHTLAAFPVGITFTEKHEA